MPSSMLLSCLLGIVCGFFTGIMPGIHVNNVAVATLLIYMRFPGLSPLHLSCFLLAAAITHSFADFIPAIFFAAPEESTALSVLPGHRFLLRGLGYEALMLTAYSGVLALILTASALPPLVKIIPTVYHFLKGSIAYILIFVLIYMVWIEQNKGKSVIIVLLSSILGLFAFHLPMSTYQTLSALLTGLFGVSVMVISYGAGGKFPKQREVKRIDVRKLAHGSVVGTIGGLIAGVLPSIGSSQAAIIVSKLTRSESERVFISALGAINTIAAIISVVSIYLIGRARSGVGVVMYHMIGNIDLNHVVFFSLLGIAIGCAAALVTIYVGKKIVSFMINRDLRKMLIFVMTVVISFMYYFSGMLGVSLLISSTVLGVMPHIWRVKKSLLMATLMVPTILIYL